MMKNKEVLKNFLEIDIRDPDVIYEDRVEIDSDSIEDENKK
jgi:hypothetical protein